MVRPLLSSRLSTAPTRPRRTASGLIRTKERWVGTSTAAVMDETLAAGRPARGPRAAQPADAVTSSGSMSSPRSSADRARRLALLVEPLAQQERDQPQGQEH